MVKMAAHRHTENNLEFSSPCEWSGNKACHLIPPTRYVCGYVNPHSPTLLTACHPLTVCGSVSVIKVISNLSSPPYTLSRPAILKLGWAAESPATTYTFQYTRPRLSAINSQTHRVSIFRSSLPTRWCQRTVWDPEAQPRQSLARQHVQKSRLKKLRAFLSVTKYWQLLCT